MVSPGPPPLPLLFPPLLFSSPLLSPPLFSLLPSPLHSSPLLLTGMPAAYDLSTVIGGGGSTVSHNNLIPLGTHTLIHSHTPFSVIC